MLWTEASLRKVARDESLKGLGSKEAKLIIEKQIIDLLKNDTLFDAIRAVVQHEMKAENLQSVVDAFRSQAKSASEEIQKEHQNRINAIKASSTRSLNAAVEKHRGAVQEELSSQSERFKALANQLQNGFDKELLSIEEKISSRIDEVVLKNLERMLLRAVRQFIRERPQGRVEMTNKELAMLNGISVREAKRWRQLARYYNISMEEAGRMRCGG